MSRNDGDHLFKTTKMSAAELKMCREEETSQRHGMAMAEKKKFNTTKTTEEELKMCASEPKVMVSGGKFDHMATKMAMPAQALKMPLAEEKCVMAPQELKMSAEATVTVFGGKIDHVTQVAPGQLKMHMTAEHPALSRVSAHEEKDQKCAVMAPAEELKVARPPAGAQGMLHQAQAELAPALSKASRYPAVLAGVAALTGISTFLYYRTVNVDSQIQGKADEDDAS